MSDLSGTGTNPRQNHSDSGDANIAPSPIPSAQFQQEAFAYVSHWCKAARDFVNRKIERWKLLEDLYHNRRELNSWSTRSDALAAEPRGSLKKHPASGKERWQADIIMSPSYIVDTWADKGYQAIFSGPEWLTVVPDNPGGTAVEDLQFPTSYKLQELLLTRLSEGRIHTRLYEVLQHMVLYGSVYAKIFWYSKNVTRHRWDYETLEVIESNDNIYDCPIVQVIPLDRMLLDWNATHNDIQRHSGIGHRVDKVYQHVLEQFSRGVYNLNKAEFLDRWQDSTATDSLSIELDHDPDSDGLDADRIKKLTVWEWHGRIPTKQGHKECLCSIVTDKNADSPEQGVMVRLTESPVLWCGLRPFLAAHYTPLPGPLGMGAVESNLDLIHSISQFVSQSQDNARLSANAQLMVRRGSSAARQISTEADVVYPGKVWTIDDPGDIQPFPPLHFPQQDINYLIDFLNSNLEKRTNVSEFGMGISGGARSATEAHLLQESASTPFSTRTDLFARSFLEPLGKIALSMLQQFLLEDQTITVRDFSGVDRPLLVTSEEIQSGRFKVVATLTRQDSTRLAKAQSIERALPTLAGFQSVLASEGVQVSFVELIKRYLDLIGVDGAERVLKRVTPKDAIQPDQTGGRPNSDPPSERQSATAPSRLVENGGPLGPEPTDANALAQFLQIQAAGGLGGSGATS
ncbi:MAG TPA: hypothetical protein VK463_01045 [Desulfomonilaceae bacterium]|nr:hypothetical protein [Desulfomonilaceae bacterium]